MGLGPTSRKGVVILKWLRMIRGDGLSQWGRRLVLLLAILLVSFTNLFLGGPVLTALLISLWFGWFFSLWVTWEHKKCDGPAQTYCSPSGEAELGICHGCEDWFLTIRGERKGQGNGAESLIEKLRVLVGTHSRDLPVIAAELAELIEGVEKRGDLKGEPMMHDDMESEAPPIPGRAERAMEGIMERISKGAEEGKGIAQALEGEEPFIGDSSEDEGIALIVKGGQYKRFLKFCEDNGEDMATLGVIRANDIGPASPKKKEPEPTACQDCGQEVGSQHLSTCPHSEAGTVTKDHARSSSAK